MVGDGGMDGWMETGWFQLLQSFIISQTQTHLDTYQHMHTHTHPHTSYGYHVPTILSCFNIRQVTAGVAFHTSAQP